MGVTPLHTLNWLDNSITKLKNPQIKILNTFARNNKLHCKATIQDITKLPLTMTLKKTFLVIQMIDVRIFCSLVIILCVRQDKLYLNMIIFSLFQIIDVIWSYIAIDCQKTTIFIDLT